MTKTISVLGPSGTFTEEACTRYDPSANIALCPTITSVGAAVSNSATKLGIVPIENSLGGSVPETLDLLIDDPNLFICDEFVIPISHTLMKKKNTVGTDIEIIFSHPQALAQCKLFLEKHFPTTQQVASLSTAAAVQDMYNSSVASAAIGTHRAAVIHQADIITENIQDNSSNATRFVVLARQDNKITGTDKTSFCVSFNEDSPGALHDVLGEFAKRGINLAKVESRPTKESLGKYIFLIDCEGHRNDKEINTAMNNIREKTSFLRIFGSYPKWDPHKKNK